MTVWKLLTEWIKKNMQDWSRKINFKISMHWTLKLSWNQKVFKFLIYDGINYVLQSKFSCHF